MYTKILLGERVITCKAFSTKIFTSGGGQDGRVSEHASRSSTGGWSDYSPVSGLTCSCLAVIGLCVPHKRNFGSPPCAALTSTFGALLQRGFPDRPWGGWCSFTTKQRVCHPGGYCGEAYSLHSFPANKDLSLGVQSEGCKESSQTK